MPEYLVGAWQVPVFAFLRGSRAAATYTSRGLLTPLFDIENALFFG
jgi:hypothetical protein